MEAVAGPNSAGYTAAPKVAYVDRKETVAFAHPRSTAQSRALAYQACRNADNNVFTSIPAVAAGVLWDAFVNQFMPT
jgi:hypothetical protein